MAHPVEWETRKKNENSLIYISLFCSVPHSSCHEFHLHSTIGHFKTEFLGTEKNIYTYRNRLQLLVEEQESKVETEESI